jgi:iron complex transport system substrate-binding protein
MRNRMLVPLILAVILSSLGSSTDYGLAVYGNANLDNIIDEKDISYVDEIINGSIEPTELADANHDGTVDDEDIQQIEQIINKSEKKLTYIDIFGEAVTINKPIERIVNMAGMV